MGARIYYVIFSWNQFSDDLTSVFRIWEGGLAIYGGIIAGFIALIVFSRKRRISMLKLCDVIAPGIVLAQCIGRWGNWFNTEAYGLPVTDPHLCFFPFAVQIPSEGNAWHMATFFYESSWDLAVFLILVFSRRRLLKQEGDVFLAYLFLYASGRFVIEDMRLDSLYAVSSVRISQLLSILLCICIMLFYLIRFKKQHLLFSPVVKTAFFTSQAVSMIVLLYSVFGTGLFPWTVSARIAFLFVSAVILAGCLFIILFRRNHHANIKN